MRPPLITLIACLLPIAGLVAEAAAAEVGVANAWVRATAPGQQVAGGFMDLAADADMAVVGGRSPVSDTVELHTMRMADGMMEMRRVREIALPRGKTVSLRPGGLHIMFIGLRRPIQAGDKVPVTLSIRDARGRVQTLDIEARARMAGGMGQHQR